jgi:hypothetical protein
MKPPMKPSMKVTPWTITKIRKGFTPTKGLIIKDITRVNISDTTVPQNRADL